MSSGHSIFSELDSNQERVVFSHNSQVIYAGPGSGKTRVLAARALHLLNAGSEKLVALSFTRKSAKELRERIGSFTHKKFNARTYHSLIFQLADSKEKAAIIERHIEALIVEQLAYEYANKNYGGRVEFNLCLNNALKKLNEHEELDKYERLIVTGFSERLEKSLVGKMTMDAFEQRIIEKVENGIIRIEDHIDQLLFDEFQDSNHWQRRFTIACYRHGVGITVVGDDDQAIYAFRQSEGARALQKVEGLPNILRTDLTNNYRSAPEIIAVSQALIQRNTSRVYKEVNAVRPSGDPVEYCLRKNKERVYKELMAHVKLLDKEQLEDAAVLCRTNADLIACAREMETHRIPCKITRLPFPLEHPKAKLLLDMIANCDTYSHYTERDPDKYRRRNKKSKYYQWWRPIVGNGELSVDQIELGARRLSSQLTKEESDAFPVELREFGGRYSRALDSCHHACKNYHSEPERAFEIIASFLRPVEGFKLGDKFYSALKQYYLALRGTPRGRAEKLMRVRKNSRGSGIELSTIHGAKGREWHTVLYPGLQQSDFSKRRDPVACHLEEININYVAFTRAKDRLVVICQKYDSRGTDVSWEHADIFNDV